MHIFAQHNALFYQSGHAGLPSDPTASQTSETLVEEHIYPIESIEFKVLTQLPTANFILPLSHIDDDQRFHMRGRRPGNVRVGIVSDGG